MKWIRSDMNEKVIIIGAGGHGRVIADIVELNGDRILGYLDDIRSGTVNGYEILGTTEDVGKFDSYYIAAIGNNKSRKQIMNKEVKWYTAVHPSAVVSKDAQIGCGSAVMANAVVSAGTKLGRGVIVNTAATVDHDCVIDDYVHVSPGAHLAGAVKIEECSWIGIGASVIECIEISRDVVVGAGSVVVDHIKEEGTYVGVPSRKLI